MGLKKGLKLIVFTIIVMFLIWLYCHRFFRILISHNFPQFICIPVLQLKFALIPFINLHLRQRSLIIFSAKSQQRLKTAINLTRAINLTILLYSWFCINRTSKIQVSYFFLWLLLNMPSFYVRFWWYGYYSYVYFRIT